MYVGSVSCLTSQHTLSDCDKSIPAVNCTGRKFDQLPVTDDSTLEVQYMYFDKNEIAEVKVRHFKKYVNLSYLSLRENQVIKLPHL